MTRQQAPGSVYELTKNIQNACNLEQLFKVNPASILRTLKLDVSHICVVAVIFQISSYSLLFGTFHMNTEGKGFTCVLDKWAPHGEQ